MPHQPFLCTNCGFWQTHFEPPTSCPVCLDFRHTPPADRWEFWDLDEVRSRTSTRFETDLDASVITFWNEPAVGIGTRGYLILHPEGAVFWDGCAFYDAAALQEIARLSEGNLTWLSASHPHAYGALWQLQSRFGARVAIPVADLGWTNAFAVSYPFNERLELTPGLEIIQTGGHFDGHCVLYWRPKKALFAGDLLKFHYQDGQLNGLSTHKAFNRQIPMSHAEIRAYRAALENLDFERVWTSFDSEMCSRADIFRLFDAQLAGAPFPTPIPFGGRE
ncbi:MAG TPA: hypothetical protein VF627_09705 [Abditibacterium sp.]